MIWEELVTIKITERTRKKHRLPESRTVQDAHDFSVMYDLSSNIYDIL